ncbi:MAG TPA: hypothetical protein VIO81_07085 [Methyloversatilis sp.]
MSISLLGAVKAVPWGDVLAAAPGVVQGANALWDRVAKKRPKGEAAAEAGAASTSAESRVAALEHAVAELQKEALATSQLIRSLAEQNELLVREVEVLRLRSRVLLLAGVAISVGLAASLYFALSATA